MVQPEATDFASLLHFIEVDAASLAIGTEIRLYQDWIAANATNPYLYAAWFNLGRVHARQGDPNAAVTAYGKALELNRGFHPAAVNLGLTLEAIGQVEAALQSWTAAIQPDDARTMLLNHKGRLLEQAGRLEEAEHALRLSLITNPAQPAPLQHWLHIRQKTCAWPIFINGIGGLPFIDQLHGPGADAALAHDTDLHHEIAATSIATENVAGLPLIEVINEAERLAQAGNTSASQNLYTRWLAHHPDHALRHIAAFNLGSLYSQAGALNEASAAFIDAIGSAPDFLPAYINAGLVAERQGQMTQALHYWAYAAHPIAPPDAEQTRHRTLVFRHIARISKNNGDIERSEEALRQCIELDSSARDVLQHWVAARQMQCKWPVIAASGPASRADIMAALSPLAAAIQTNDPLYQLANASRSFRHNQAEDVQSADTPIWRTPTCNRPLRIGYVSPDFREHAVGFLTSALFAHHDRTKIEVYAYFSGSGGPDAVQEKIRDTVDRWCNIAGWAAARTAEKVRDDGIDILVDLGGHTGESPAAAIALRPAPVIVNWLGYPGTMGTPHHHYIIADATILPPDHEKYYSETVMRLPCYQPTDPARHIGPTQTRARLGLPENAMVFCCFNGTQKITPALFRCWMTILIRAPGSILWLLSCDLATDGRLRHQASLCGVSPNRLIFADRLSNPEHLARYHLADLFLDTFPYGAHTTASDALWLGLPVLTIAGRSFASRVCASLVTAAGSPDLVCTNLDAYADQAVAFGTRPDLRTEIRNRLRSRRDTCTLFDMPNLVQHLETLYGRMWNAFTLGHLPEPDLSNLDLYAMLGDGIDHDASALVDMAEYESGYRRALMARGERLADHWRLPPANDD